MRWRYTGLMNQIDLFRGALLGLACGDAVGTTLEFKPRGSFTPITDMVGGGPFHLQPGQWTDDTSMAMCLAEPGALRHLRPARSDEPLRQLVPARLLECDRRVLRYRYGNASCDRPVPAGRPSAGGE